MEVEDRWMEQRWRSLERPEGKCGSADTRPWQGENLPTRNTDVSQEGDGGSQTVHLQSAFDNLTGLKMRLLINFL